MQIRNLFEEFRKYVKIGDRVFAIYSNPTSEDFNAIRKEEDTKTFRYIVRLHNGNELHIFNAELLHYDAAKSLGIPYKFRVHYPIWGDYGFGQGEIYESDNKMNLDPNIIKYIKRMGKKGFDIEFLSKYFIL